MVKVLIPERDAAARRELLAAVDWAAIGCEILEDEAGGAAELILTDLQTLSRLREWGCRIPVIVAAESSEFEQVRAALRLGAADYLLKPLREQELAAALERICSRPELQTAAGEKSKYVQQVMDYIAAHYAEAGISIADIAAALGVSEGHLSHVFKNETGITVISYLTRYRIRMAGELLARGGLKVYEVAHRVGYRDVAYFSSTFRKLTGRSPSEHRM